MTFVALLLVLISTFIHAYWNFLSKRSGGGVSFVWLFMGISTAVYTPIAIGIIIYQQVRFDWIDWLFILGSMFVHLIYFIALQTAYRVGDFSIVYPIARGTAPLLSSFAAIFIFQEQVSVLTIVGILLIVGSVFLLTGGPDMFKKRKTIIPVLYSLGIGVAISIYTIIDKGAVSERQISPVLLEYFSALGQFIILTPYAIKKWGEVKFEWNQHRKEAFLVGILHSLAYILVLIALIFAPVTHVAPLRELSILIGVLIGVKFLSEELGTRRIIAALIMVVGVIILSVY